MAKRLKAYIKYLDGQLGKSMTPEERKALKEDFLIQIVFFQNERLIHLIVTVTFAVLALMTILCSFFYQSIGLFILILLFFVLLFPYITHYFNLENGVQKLYTYYDKIVMNEYDTRKT